jgi:chromosome segregation ATPase
MTIIAALKDKEGVGELVLRRLGAAGFITVGQLLMASPDEIAAVAGIHLNIVHTILGHLSPASAEHEPAEEAMPVEVELLHEQILDKLRAEAETEASREELTSEIRELHSRIFNHRAELKSLDICLNSKTKAWDLFSVFSEQMASNSDLLDEYRARRDALERRYVSSEESIQQMEERLQALRQERRSVEEQMVSLSRAVGWLVEEVEKVRRTVAKKQVE